MRVFSLAVTGVPILYDADCGFCRVALAAVLTWDRRGRLRPVALQDPAAAELLRGMSEEQRMRSWHLVPADGEVYSGGRAFAPLLRLLPGGRPLALVPAAAPGLAERAYRLVADRRSTLGPLLPDAWKARAQRVIDRRTGDE
jgi:predicted DCC family thiol-disulfide oxidoreductase YuxK